MRKPTVAGTRITVELILGEARQGRVCNRLSPLTCV
jgi:uncharacterized protein (DUF433 family)